MHCPCRCLRVRRRPVASRCPSESVRPRRCTFVLVTLVVTLVAAAAWGDANHVVLSIHVAFADDQVDIFHQMIAQTSTALSHTPPDTQGAVAFLEYTHVYYPSGTKQVTGSRLDTIVERARAEAETQIVDMLRDKTDEDLSEDPEAWIRKFNGRMPPKMDSSQSRGSHAADAFVTCPAANVCSHFTILSLGHASDALMGHGRAGRADRSNARIA